MGINVEWCNHFFVLWAELANIFSRYEVDEPGQTAITAKAEDKCVAIITLAIGQSFTSRRNIFIDLGLPKLVVACIRLLTGIHLSKSMLFSESPYNIRKMALTIILLFLTSWVYQ